MEISDDSSDDCNIYINAASKLNALNRRAKCRIKDESDSDDDIVCDEPEKVEQSSTLNNQQENNKSTDINALGEDSEDESDEVASPILILDEDLVLCTENNASKEIISRDNNRTPRKITRSLSQHSNKASSRSDALPNIDDTIDEVLSQSYNDDSLNLLQDENDSYVLIGSPIASTKCNRDNYEVSIKVLWRSNQMERFEIRRYETFQKVFRHFANLEGVSEDQILITKKDKRITPFDTPLSINWSIIDILEGGVVSAEIAKKNKGNLAQNKADENTCKIKIQTSDKRTITVSLKHDQTFKALVHSCAEQLSIPVSKMKFYFDGELIDTDETPESLDLDDEACFDLKIAK